MQNPIRIEELVSADALEYLKKLGETVSNTREELVRLLGAVRDAAGEIKAMGTGGSRSADDVAALLRKVDALEDAYILLKRQIDATDKVLKDLSTEKQKHAALTDEERKRIAELTAELEKMKQGLSSAGRGVSAFAKLTEEETAKVEALKSAVSVMLDELKKGNDTKIGADVDVDVNAASLNELKAVLAVMKEAFSSLNAEQRQGTTAGLYFTEQIGRIEAALKSAKRETDAFKASVEGVRAEAEKDVQIKAYAKLDEASIERVKALADTIKAALADTAAPVQLGDLTGEGSINEMTAKLGVLKEAWNALTEEERKNTFIGVEIEGAMASLNTAIAAAKGGIDEYAASVEELRRKIEQARVGGYGIEGIDVQGKSIAELKVLLKALQEEYEKLSQSERTETEAGRSMAENMRNISGAIRAAKAETAALSAAKARNTKLTEEETANVERLRQQYLEMLEAMRAVRTQSAENVVDTGLVPEDIDEKVHSYNELYAIYNAMKEALNGMTQAEREGTRGGRDLEAQARRVYETMNRMQQATGKFVLNVGNYRSAFDGLGYSIQQVLREAPSALNLNQFFLAISNNIPMVVDQLNAFKKQQEDIKKNMEDLAAQGRANTAEYQQLGSQVMSVGKKIAKSVLNWQTAILVALMALRNYDKIFAAIKKWIERIRDGIVEWVRDIRVVRGEMLAMWAAATESVQQQQTELALLVDRMGSVKRGTAEWAEIVGRVNEITGSTLNTISAMPGEVRKVAEEFLEMQKKIALNKEVVDRLAKSDLANAIIGSVSTNVEDVDASELARLIVDKDNDDYEEVERAVKRLQNSRRKLASEQKKFIEQDNLTEEEITERLVQRIKEENINATSVTNYVGAPNVSMVRQAAERAEKSARNTVAAMADVRQAYLDATHKDMMERNADVEKKQRQLEALAKRARGDVYTDAQYRAIANLYDPTLDTSKSGGGRTRKEKDPTLENMGDRYFEAEEARIKRVEEGLQKELSLITLTRDKVRDELATRYVEEVEALEKNLANRLISQEEYSARMLQLQQQHDELIAHNDYDAEQKRLKTIQDFEVAAIEERRKAYNEELAERVKKSKTAAEQEQELSRGVDEAAASLASLEAIVERDGKAFDDLSKAIEDAQKQLKKLQGQREAAQVRVVSEEMKKQEVYVRRRVKTERDEATRNRDISRNIMLRVEAMQKLKQMELETGEGVEENIKLYKQWQAEVEKLIAQVDHTKELSTWSSFGDFFNKKVGWDWLADGDMTGFMENILGDNAYAKIKIAIDAEEDPEAKAKLQQKLEDMVGKDFDTWVAGATDAVKEWYSTTINYVNEMISAFVELAEAKAEAAREETDAAREEYEKEKALLEAGYANRVETTWAEYQEKKAAQEQAERDAREAAQMQEELNSISQIGSLISAAAKMFEFFSGLGPLGIALATAATAAMFGAFVSAKAKAREAATAKYERGGFEIVNGGSHASGHDVDLGVDNRHGRRMRVEGEEGIGIFSKMAMRRYRPQRIERLVNSVNRGTWEGDMQRMMVLERNVGSQVVNVGMGADLRRLEAGVGRLVEQGRGREYVDGKGRRVVERGNGRTIYVN